MRLLVVVLTVVVGVLSAAAVIGIRHVGSDLRQAAPQATGVRPAAAQTAARHPTAAAASHATSCRGRKVGVATDNLGQFEKATTIYPSVAVNYVDWGTPFPAATVLGNHGIGVTTQLVLEPRKVNLRDIAAGRDNQFLASWAQADKRLGLPIILSFAPEANGGWYPWGDTHVTASVFRQAWREVHQVLYEDGARKITWMWQVNVIFPASEPLSELWPGGAYVNQVGIDGHLRKNGDTFSAVFGPTIEQLRTITKRPVVIGEIAVDRSKYRVRQINELFAGVCNDKIRRFVWFDIKRGEVNFELEGDSAALTAFRKGAAKLGPA